MQTIVTSRSSSHATVLPTQPGPTSVVDATSTCGCGQALDSRHLRCTRCGR